LNPGEFYAFGPAFTRVPDLVKIGPVATTHPKAGQRLLQAPPPASEKVRAELAKLIDLQKDAEQEARTVEELQALNAKLKREATIANKRAEQAGVPEKEVEARIRAALAQYQRQHPPAVLCNTGAETKALAKIAAIASKALNEIPTGSHGSNTAEGPIRAVPASAGGPRTAPARPAPAVASAGGSTGLPTGERATLIACAQHQLNGCTREQLSILTGYNRSTRDAYIQRMREKALVQVDGTQIVATPAGIAALGDGFEPLPTGSALRAHWLERLPRGEAAILRLLCDAYPEHLQRDALSDLTGFARSSRDAYLQRLKARQLVKVDRGTAAATSTLFDP
jgi:hypothetical protein